MESIENSPVQTITITYCESNNSNTNKFKQFYYPKDSNHFGKALHSTPYSTVAILSLLSPQAKAHIYIQYCFGIKITNYILLIASDPSRNIAKIHLINPSIPRQSPLSPITTLPSTNTQSSFSISTLCNLHRLAYP